MHSNWFSSNLVLLQWYKLWLVWQSKSCPNIGFLRHKLFTKNVLEEIELIENSFGYCCSIVNNECLSNKYSNNSIASCNRLTIVNCCTVLMFSETRDKGIVQEKTVFAHKFEWGDTIKMREISFNPRVNTFSVQHVRLYC